MSDRLEAVKAQFDAMIARMKEECYRRVDLEMEVLLEMWREEKRMKMKKKKTTRGRTGKRMRKDKTTNGEGGGGQQLEDEDSVSVKSEIESDECGCDSDEEDNSNFEVKEELTDEEDTIAPVASTSGGRKRWAMTTRQVAAKKGRMSPPVDTERQESASKPGIYKIKIISIDCSEDNCQRTFRCVHKMREHLLVVHKMKPFQCRAQGCGQQFDKKGELMYHGRTHPRATTTWLCPHCPGKTFTSSNRIGTHICDYHQSGQFQCAFGQCQFTGTTRDKVYNHQHWAHRLSQHICPFEGCTRSFKSKADLTRHQRIYTSTTPFRCTMKNCGYEAKQRSDVVRHIRIVHFHLPATLQEQHRRGIIDHRDPNEFIQVNDEALANH